MSDRPSPEQIRQSIFDNVTARDITVESITQIVNLGDYPKPTGIPYNIPATSTVRFVGRSEALERLHQMLQQNNQVVIAAIEGMGGVGKTELATQYALLHLLLLTYQGGICWLRARDEDIGIQIVRFAQTELGLKPPEDLDLPEQVRWCWRRWRDGDVLVVLDDVNDYPKVEPYLPPQPSQFKVLITTRLQLELSESLTLDVLGEEAALELLRQWVGSEKINQQLVDAKELCQRLGYLPLALNLVGRYVKKRKLPLAEMLRRLEEKGLRHQSLDVDNNERTWTFNIKRGVAAAFELSWEELSEKAKQLGCLLSLFALAPITWSLVESVETGRDTEDLEDTRVELESLHLVQGEETYRLHQLIREFFQEKLKQSPQAENFKRAFGAAMVAVAKQIPERPTRQQIETLTPAIPHLTEVARNLATNLRDEDLTTHFEGLGWFYRGQGFYPQAEFWFQECLKVTESRFGREHAAVATSLNNLALIYRLQGRYSEAEPLYLRALNIGEYTLPPDHPYLAIRLNNLALLYKKQGRYSEAESLYLRALEIDERSLPPDHPDLAIDINNLAALYDSQGRYSEAESLYLRALEIDERSLPPDHPELASHLSNLAGLYHSQGRYSEAEPLYLRVLAIDERSLHPDHPHLAIDLNNLANLYKSQRRYSEAEPLYLRALEIDERSLPQDHPELAKHLSRLADLYRFQGRYSEAAPLYVQALAICEHRLESDNPLRRNIRESFAAFLRLAIREDYADLEALRHDPSVQAILVEVQASLDQPE